MPQASAKSNTVQPDKLNEPIFTPRFIAGFAVNFILYMQYYALMVAMAGYSAMQFAAGATEGGFTASVFILGALCSRLFFGGVIDKVGRGRVLVACMTGEVACTLLYLALSTCRPLACSSCCASCTARFTVCRKQRSRLS